MSVTNCVASSFNKKSFVLVLLLNLDIWPFCCEGLATTTIDCMGYGNPGRSTVLTCEIAGTIVAGIRWLRPNGGTPLTVMTCNIANTLCLPANRITGYSVSRDSPTHQTLTIESFNPSLDAGEWICRDGITGAGQLSCKKIILSGPDSITFSPPPPGSVAEGDSLTVMCAASCNPQCSYSWTLRNQQISPTTQLKLTNINRSETGNVYMCNTTNSLIPKSKTKQFTLTVYYGPDSIRLNTTSPLTVKEGDDVAVSCEATNCSPSCSYTWKFNSQIKPTSSVLSLNNIQRSAAGDYTCTATNTNTQKSLDKTITLDVQYQSSITSLTLNSQSTLVTVDELTPMTLRCDVDSNPGSHIKLLNNSQTLHEVTNSKQTEYTWNEAGCLDTGHYTCEAGNNIKSAVSESVQLVVRCSPRLDHRVQFQKQFAAAVGGSVTLEISVIANPTPTFTWYKRTDGNRNNIGSGSSSTTNVSAVGKLRLTNVQQGDIGTYQVVVSNGAPRQDLAVNLTLDVAGPPNIPSDVTAWSTGPDSISVAWKEGFNGGSKQMFIVQYRADTTTKWTNLTEEFPEKGLQTNHTAFISNLQPKTRYLVRVSAYNKYGRSNFTQEQEALTKEEPSNAALIGGIAGGLTGGVVIIVIVIVLVLLFIRRRNQDSKQSEKPAMASASNENGGVSGAVYAIVNKVKRNTGASTRNQSATAVGGSVPPNGDIYAAVDKKKKTRAKAGTSGQAEPGVGETYAVVDKSKKTAAVKKPKEKKKAGSSGQAEPGVEETYALVDKSKKTAAKKKPQEKPKQNPKAKGKKKDVDDEKHVYGNDNFAFVKDEKTKKPAKGKKALPASRQQTPQLNYTTVEFGSGKPSTAIHQAEEPIVYIDLDFTKKAPAMDPDTGSAK